ncbi:DUF7347 domain-containing protein [Haloarchaeobius sp. DFWS5]|uniref:transcriptional regulator n=1 Tax=Haloarchaeobius sp. DFWS5 TaxID=3446114 RepID=UPI003EBA17F3
MVPPDTSDALEVLGNEIRMRILRELADTDEPLAFSELRRRVGVRDTGKFNYHLTRLCEYYVRECHDGGYELGRAGTRVITAADPGRTAVSEADGSAATDETCPVCGESNCEKLFHVHLTPPWA